MEDEYLKINYEIWIKELFNKVINPIVKHCHYLLNETCMNDNKTQYICIVGGLGSSKYLQHRMIKEFGLNSKYGLNDFDCNPEVDSVDNRMIAVKKVLHQLILKFIHIMNLVVNHGIINY